MGVMIKLIISNQRKCSNPMSENTGMRQYFSEEIDVDHEWFFTHTEIDNFLYYLKLEDVIVETV
jgi:hypothetical protein